MATKIGKTFTTNEGYQVEIIEALGTRKVIIEFANGYQKEVWYKDLCNGKVKNPFHCSVLGLVV